MTEMKIPKGPSVFLFPHPLPKMISIDQVPIQAATCQDHRANRGTRVFATEAIDLMQASVL